MGDAVEETLQISIHHPRVAFFEELIHFSEGILGPPLGSKPIAAGEKLLLKDRLYYQTLLKDTTPLRYYQGSDSSTSHQRQRSPWFSRLTFLMFHPQPRYAPDPRFIHHRNGISVFQTSPRMSKLVANMPPNRVRSPTDHHFASGCSPPRLMATQLPSATWLWFTMARTFTVLIKRLPRRTHSCESRNPVAMILYSGYRIKSGMTHQQWLVL